MTPNLAALLVALARGKRPEPADLASSLRELPEPGVLPSPWETWTLFGLVRHRKRQMWVAEIIRSRLHGSPVDAHYRGWTICVARDSIDKDWKCNAAGRLAAE